MAALKQPSLDREPVRRFQKANGRADKHLRKASSQYQQAYEHHVNCEFTEAELVEIIGFLERQVDKHFLDERWRMEAYVETNVEELEEQIVKEAIANFTKWGTSAFHS